MRDYNQHVRLLSSEPFGWFAPPSFIRGWEPTLSWNYTPSTWSRSPPLIDLKSSHSARVSVALFAHREVISDAPCWRDSLDRSYGIFWIPSDWPRAADFQQPLNYGSILGALTGFLLAIMFTFRRGGDKDLE
jgi:hypothetical protein